MCTGLEMCLRQGILVRHYLHADVSVAARRVASSRIHALHAQYPHLFPSSAFTHAFSVPFDVRDYTHSLISDLVLRFPGRWLIVSGWPCEDMSNAGVGRGLS